MQADLSLCKPLIPVLYSLAGLHQLAESLIVGLIEYNRLVVSRVRLLRAHCMMRSVPGLY